jgi:hypothetical protein
MRSMCLDLHRAEIQQYMSEVDVLVWAGEIACYK